MSIETLRGVAIVLMVAGHVVGSKPEFAMQVQDESPWRFIFWGFQDIRMPLFSVISGYLYAFRPVSAAGQVRQIIQAKARRLLIPLLVIGTLLFWTKLITPGTNSKPDIGDWWRPYINGMDHLWFLQAIFLIFAFVAILDLTPVLVTAKSWAITTMVVGTAFVLAPEEWGIFGVSGALRLLPFFLLGYGFRKFGFDRARPRWKMVGVVSVVALYVPRILSVYGVFEMSLLSSRSIAVGVGITSVSLMFWFRSALANSVLAWVGQFAFCIYLLHYFTASAARILLRLLSLDSNVAVFIGGLLAGIGGPIIFQLATKRMPVVRLLVLGEKLKTRPADSAATPHESVSASNLNDGLNSRLPQTQSYMIALQRKIHYRLKLFGGSLLVVQWAVRYLSFTEVEEIALLRVQSTGVREIARAVNRASGTISRKLRRNAAVRSRSSGYRASVARWKADMTARRPKISEAGSAPALACVCAGVAVRADKWPPRLRIL